MYKLTRKILLRIQGNDAELNTSLAQLDINNKYRRFLSQMYDFAVTRLLAVFIDHFLADSHLLLISIWLKNERHPSVLFRAYAAKTPTSQFAGNKTSTGMGLKCTHTTIAKQARIVWLNKISDNFEFHTQASTHFWCSRIQLIKN